jgi:cellulose synthase (UDP-forming)
VETLLDLGPTLALLGLALLVLPGLSRGDGPARVAVMAISLACMARYLVWRLTETLPPFALDDPASLWMWGLAAMETLATLNAMITALFLCRHSNRSAAADAHEARLRLPSADLPAVDVVIATCNEPIEVLERSIVGALALDWPQVRVWVLDDGRRDWLAAYCAGRGIHHVTRDGNADGKAGNINAWLRSNVAGMAPYILVLDADFVPQRNFLWRVMGFFADESVALVQTPQSFFNPDPIQMNLLCGTSFADEQRFFYHHFQPALDAWGAAFCCGTSFVVRRDRLEAIGGIPADTVTEDMMTTYALASRGWRTLYLDEKLSSGLAPEGLAEFIGQRARWCMGTVQAMRSPRGPFRAAGIGWASRLCFLNAQLFWLASVPLMLLATMAPIVWWWTGTPAFLAGTGAFLDQFGPRFVAEAAAVTWVSRGAVVPILSGLAPLVAAPTAIAAAFRGLLRPHGQRFKVTMKGGDRTRVVVHGRMVAWIGVLMAALAVGMLMGEVPELAPDTAGESTAITLGWSAYALALLFLALLVCIEVPRRRGHERLPFAEPARLRWPGGVASAWLSEMSLSGAGLTCEGGPEAGPVEVEVQGVGWLAAEVVRSRSHHRLSLRFRDLGGCRDALLVKLYAGPAALPGDGLDPMRALRAALRRGFVSAD